MTTVHEGVHRQLGMSDDEYASVVGILGRDPRPAELAMYSVMWSEHCSYKSSRVHLGRFPTEAPWVVVGPGENAGVVDIGDGWLAALRIESHNHPSFVEPYQGAATGVGGILRDVFTMGARPIALWDQIRFGPLAEPKNRYLFKGVVAGIAGYGNAVGVPTVGGEVEFDDCYTGNPLVNVMCLGLLRRGQLVLGTAGEPGSVAILLGKATGRDGIGGASVLASASFEEESPEKRPSVQVGDPFEEKKLIEACLELYDKGLVVGVQDLGAAGLSCATSEPASRAGVGMEVDLDAVHTRETGMTAPELLMSESQERMMAFVAPEKVDAALSIANKWEIDSAVVGVVKAGNTLSINHNGALVAEVPAASLADDAPLYDRPLARPQWLDEFWSRPAPAGLETIGTLEALLGDPAIGSSAWIHEQYDHMLFLNTVVGPGNDGSLLRIKGTNKALAVSTDGNGRLCLLDPRIGGARLVYEAALNVAVTGAKPLAVVDNLNFGNPEKPEVMWQFRETVEGISEACETLGIPVIGGNVSFYNETDGVDIHPTPVVGLLGLADPMPANPPRLDRAEEGMGIWVLGPEPTGNLAGSSAQRVIGDLPGGRPLPPEPQVATTVIALAADLAHRAPVLHDVSDGGLAVTIAEICIRSAVGATVDTSHPFCEDPHRFVAVMPEQKASFPPDIARRIGVIGGTRIDFGNGASIAVDVASRLWRRAIPEALGD